MRLFSSATFLLSSLGSSSSSSVCFWPRTFLLHFSQFSTSSSSSSSSSSGNHSFQSSSSSRRHVDESRNVRVLVWWDFENCNIPAGVNVFKVAHLITAAVRANGIKGPVQITAFGDTLQLSRSNQEALSSTGISLTHIPHGGKNSADRSLLVDLMNWVSQNSPPAHLFLISGDRDFASILHRLRMNNYNVLLASPETAPGVLCSAASIMWNWFTLIRGENLVGRHVNQPPDGMYGSWYGHYKVPLEDPFPVNEQPSSLRAEEVSMLNSDPKLRRIPKTVVRQIHNILKLYPKGIIIRELRLELGKSNVSMDRDFYGYKKFSRFLLSMPHILKLERNVDGQFIVKRVTPRPIERTESSRTTFDNGTEDRGPTLIAKLNNNSSSTESMSIPVLPSSELNAQDETSSEFGKSIGEAMKREPSRCLVSEPNVIEDSKQTSKFETDNNLSIGQHFETKMGFLRRIWRMFLGNNDHNSENGSQYASAKCFTLDNTSKLKSCIGLGEAKTEGKTVKPVSPDANSVNPVSKSCDRESSKLQKIATVADAYDDKSSSNPGLLGSIRNWFKFQGKNVEVGKISEHCCEHNQLKYQSGKHHLFSSNSFWQDMQSFMETDRGVEIITRSKTRLEMAQNLLEGGPSDLKCLSTSDLFDFLELLISDKKWVEECPSKTNAFKLTLSGAKKRSCTKLHHENRLTSICMNKVSQPNLQGFPEHDSDSDKKSENIPQAGISTTLTKSKFSERTRSKILDDCQKLVDEVLSEHPEGYNIGDFRKLFLEKNGYHLDLQKLGYPKLASLLQIMPGVTITSTFMVPTSKGPKVSNRKTVLPSDPEKKTPHVVVADSDDESFDLPRKDDDFESTWEELGPAYTGCRSINEEELGLGRETAEASEKLPKGDYEPVLSEDVLTESDGESCSTTQRSEEQVKLQTNDEECSLLQILDSWHSSKEDISREDQLENNDEMIDCSENRLKPSSLAHKCEANSANFAGKRRHQRSYSFVSESNENDKGKLINDILGALQKSI